MSTHALTANRAPAARGSRAKRLLRSPFPVWAALFVNVLAFSGLPTAVPHPHDGRSADHPGFADLGVPARTDGQSALA